MLLKDILKDVDYKLLQGDINTDIDDIAYDSRKVKKGTAFVALPGANVDGHDYIDNAILLGASALIVEKDINIDCEIPVIKLDNTRKKLSYLSASLFSYPHKKLITIAITGTKGKTTSSWMIKNILEESGKKVAVIGTMGIFIGEKHYTNKNTTPESYEIHKYMNEMVEDGIEYLVMEVSSQALKIGRVEGIEFDYGIFTNLSPDHIGENEHENYADYVYCKSLLFKQCKQGIFNIDDSEYLNMIKDATCDIHTYGKSKNADLVEDEIELLTEPGFIGINLKTSKLIEDTFRVNTPGQFSAYNAMCAILTCYLLGVDKEFMKKALSTVAVKGRVEPIKVSDDFNLLIDYAHNGMSMESVLSTIRDYKPKRIVSLFGCGGNRSKDRRYEMGEISGRLADFSIITADNSRYEDVNDIISDILIGMKKTDGEYITIPDRKEAIKYSIQNGKKGDIILVLGKGHEDYQEIKGVRYPFDERIIIKEILEELKNTN